MLRSDFCFIMPYHISEARGGGAEVQAWLLAKELARQGYGVSYVAQSVSGKKGQMETVDGVDLYWVSPAKRLPWTVAGDYYRTLQRIAPRVLIQRMTSFETGLAGYYCHRHQIPFIWVCTDDAIPYRWHFLKKQLVRSRAAGQPVLKRAISCLNALIVDLSRHYGMTRIGVAFTQNDRQQKALHDSFGLESWRMISGHEPSRTTVSTEERLANRLVLWTANLGPHKQPEKFIELARRNQGSDWKFIMIGGKADDEYVRKLFQDKPENLQWLGRLTFEETLSWFDRAAWFVNTSLVEGFPNTYIQAWLRGVPVLSLGCDPDGVIVGNGLGCVCSDIDQMAATLDGALSNGTYDGLSRRVAEYAMRRHSTEVMAGNFRERLMGYGVIVEVSP